MKGIQYGKHNVTKKDITSVVKILKSDYLTQGPTVSKFENKVKDYCNVDYSVAVNSATSALHIACLALDLGPGDILWTVPNTFVASANCALYCGANIDFVDIDIETYNICIKQLEYKLIESEKVGKLPKILIPVHYAGQSCDMEAIFLLSKKYKFKIIEDASHAIGGKYKNIKIGSCKYSDITVFSFHPVKIITTGEGGMALTNNLELFYKMQRYRSHGITSDINLFKKRPKYEIWNFQQIDLGFNYRMTDIQAALGISQMDNLDKNVMVRNNIANKYNHKLNVKNIILPFQNQYTYSSYHLYPIRIYNKSVKHRELYDKLFSLNIFVNVHYIPVYLHPFYKNLGFKRNYCPNSEIFFQSALSIPIFPTLKNAEQLYIINNLNKILIN